MKKTNNLITTFVEFITAKPSIIKFLIFTKIFLIILQSFSFSQEIIKVFGNYSLCKVFIIDTNDNSHRLVETYRFNSNGDIVEWIDKADSSNIWKCLYYYENNQLITREVYNNNNEKKGYVYSYKYDNNGNLIEKTTFNNKGFLSHKYVYKYDLIGNIIEKNLYSYDINGGYCYKNPTYSFLFDSLGRIKEKKSFRSNKTLLQYEIYDYNSANKIIEINSFFEHYNKEVDSITTVNENCKIKHDTLGREIYIAETAKDLWNSETFKKYDNYGNLIEIIRIELNSSVDRKKGIKSKSIQKYHYE